MEDDNMPMAYVLINTEPKNMESVVSTLEKNDSVIEIFPVYGVYDIVAKIGADSMDKLNDVVTLVRSLDKIRATVTLILIKKET